MHTHRHAGKRPRASLLAPLMCLIPAVLLLAWTVWLAVTS